MSQNRTPSRLYLSDRACISGAYRLEMGQSERANNGLFRRAARNGGDVFARIYRAATEQPASALLPLRKRFSLAWQVPADDSFNRFAPPRPSFLSTNWSGRPARA